MTAMATEHDHAWLTTSDGPYLPGDPVSVEIEHGWHEAIVQHVSPILGITRFGVRWMVAIRLTSNGFEAMVACNDDGRNYTRGSGVRPSEQVDL